MKQLAIAPRTVQFATWGGSGDGQRPLAALVLGSDGHFYGDTLEGGTANAGVFFRY